MQIQSENFAQTTWYTLSNDDEVSVTVSTLGASLVAVRTPDQTGRRENILLGFTDPDDYPQHHDYFGATVARVAGRIKNGRWHGIQFDQNDGANTMHGGDHPSISYQQWQVVAQQTDPEAATLTLQYQSPAGENGFPGHLTIQTTYCLNQDHLTITYDGTTDAATLFNPTCHAYFNLSGNVKRTIDEQFLQVDAQQVAALDHKVPTGTMMPVAGTPYDFRQARQLGPQLAQLDGGLDTPYRVDSAAAAPQLTLSDPLSGRKLRIHTSANSIVLFSTTGFDADFQVDGIRPMTSQLGLAIEPQMLPDAIHHPDFGSIVITPNQPGHYQNQYWFQ
ncbi:hypothetical protein IV38_GL001074 [Lactobacillus selangorensis]|uniref:Maltose epimerase n=1 Tax=Lactobacillus selangorensis TaxID=81857 RepID=A0A0R2G7U0_9LACO|nr:aldose epimerase family protein [Lactobacillus selangorensis]KRN28866.1 hypothetical protein IV38_GL001074 [Lactobacillus selangorensis]KRN32724.1 hypothetical protein IV40_GL000779 [Lactobacillus selangorensis]